MLKTMMKHDAGDEFRHDRRGESGDDDGAVDPGVRLERRDNAAENPQRHDEDEGDAGELERVEQRMADEGRHRRAIGIGHAHVAVQHAG